MTVVAPWRPGFSTTTLLDRTYKRDKDGRFGSGGGDGIRPALADAKTTEEVATAASAELGRIMGRPALPVRLNGLDVEVARAHMEGLCRGAELYPGAELRSVGTYGGSESSLGHSGALPSNAYAITVGPNAGSAPGPSAIYFNTRLAPTMEVFRHQMTQDDSLGHLGGQTGDTRRVAAHEFGHVVHFSISENAPQQAVTAASRQARAAGVKAGAYIEANIGSYAKTNGKELIGEAFADVALNGDDAGGLSHDVLTAIGVGS